MPCIEQLGYLVFEVSDPRAWERFLTRVVGAEKGVRFDGPFVPYRLDDRAARILLEPGSADDVVALGFEVCDQDTMRAVAARARAHGHSSTSLSSEEARARGVQAVIRMHEPGGVAVEVFCGAARASEPFRRETVATGFVTDELGLGHLALRADEIPKTRAFFEEVLGFRLSDHIRCTLPGDFRVDITFLHVNARHHSIALGSGLPKHLHHFMLQMGSLDDVGAALDRAFRNDVRVVQGLGRHPNDRMVSFYCHTPSGFECEIGWGGRTVDDSTWEPTTYDRISEWGHQSPYRKFPAHRTQTEKSR